MAPPAVKHNILLRTFPKSVHVYFCSLLLKRLKCCSRFAAVPLLFTFFWFILFPAHFFVEFPGKVYWKTFFSLAVACRLSPDSPFTHKTTQNHDPILQNPLWAQGLVHRFLFNSNNPSHQPESNTSTSTNLTVEVGEQPSTSVKHQRAIGVAGAPPCEGQLKHNCPSWRVCSRLPAALHPLSFLGPLPFLEPLPFLGPSSSSHELHPF